MPWHRKKSTKNVLRMVLFSICLDPHNAKYGGAGGPLRFKELTMLFEISASLLGVGKSLRRIRICVSVGGF